MSDMTRDETRQAFLHSDREDLLTVLALRFGPVPESVHARIAACDDAAALARWILVAANAPDWASFLNDLDTGPRAFRLLDARYESHSAGSGSKTAPRATGETHAVRGTQPKEE
jgi:hypothetical protein